MVSEPPEGHVRVLGRWLHVAFAPRVHRNHGRHTRRPAGGATPALQARAFAGSARDAAFVADCKGAKVVVFHPKAVVLLVGAACH